MATWIPVIAAVAAAVFAGWMSLRNARWQFRAQRMMELERRAAVSKSEVFEPFIGALGEFWDRIGEDDAATQDWTETNVMPRLREFLKWVSIYGSDDLIWTIHRWMQALYADAPPNVTMRLLTEATLAFRRDLGNPDTKVTALDLLGLRINDIYSEEHLPTARLSERALFKREGWTPPWGQRFRFGTPLRP